MTLAVLVVEDTDLLRRMYVDRLQQDGYRILQAANGLDALSILRHDTPDLILLDLIMPQMGGIEFLEVVKRDPRLNAVPVLVLSNLGQDSDVQRCIELGATDYLLKNEARPDHIAEKVKAILTCTHGGDERPSYRLLLQERLGDIERFVKDAHLTKRLWCPACETQLNLELVAQPERPGWYDAHILCPRCGREY